MTTTIPTSHDKQPLDSALRPTHEAWVRDARRFLEPATEPGADFWTRWAAVRYLSDEFREQYRLERAFVDEIRPFLTTDTAERLDREGDVVARWRLELDRIGRRRGTAEEMAAGTVRLLEQLALWLVEIERAAAGVPRRP